MLKTTFQPSEPWQRVLHGHVPEVAGAVREIAGANQRRGRGIRHGAILAADGTITIDPDGAAPLFEVPIAGPLPETRNF